MALERFWPRARVGLALGSGGLSGLAHIGVLRVFEEEGIPIHALSGCSMGSIVAALYGCGWSPRAMEEAVVGLSTTDLYDFPVSARALASLGWSLLAHRLRLQAGGQGPPPPMGLMAGKRIEAQLREWTRERTFAELQRPVAVVATDINTGERIVFGPRHLERALQRSGDRSVFVGDVTVAEAVRASISIPGIFAPKVIHGRPLVDGALVDGVPDSLLRPLGARLSVAVSLDFLGGPPTAVGDITEVLGRSIDVMGAAITQLRSTARVVIRPRPGDIGLTQFHKVPACIEEGAAAARRAIAAVHAARTPGLPSRRRAAGADVAPPR